MSHALCACSTQQKHTSVKSLNQPITYFINPIQDEGNKKASLPIFSCNFSKPRSPKLLNFKQDHPSKNWFSLSSLNKTEVMIIALNEMLELPNFGYMSKSAI